MKKLEVFDPAMCCPTGVCGPSVDPELTRIASALFLIEGKGFTVKRYNLASEPDAFIDNAKDVLKFLLIGGSLIKVFMLLIQPIQF
ncbi:hypothetical protein CU633_03880 [Bacillus sp. V3-13]|nr:hypothetical protein CU633_03880 [Bacillus sp. V3-13]